MVWLGRIRRYQRCSSSTAWRSFTSPSSTPIRTVPESTGPPRRRPALFEPLVRAHPGNPDYLYGFADASNELGDAYRSLSQVDLAQKAWQKTLGLAEDLARSHPANGYYRHLVADIAYSLASLAYHERRQPGEARPLLQKAFDIEDELNISFPTVSEYSFYRANLVRDFRDWFGETGPLAAWCQRLSVTIADYEKQARSKPEKKNQERLAAYYRYRAYFDWRWSGTSTPWTTSARPSPTALRRSLST